ncbi:leucyl aminopeptidase [Exilibacterium tricleocarpae]|uniref:leucyl aminopeptidase n=1 Tax=Exilibacterium tricleocarpae TaxID=2591008 RepID=UPI0015D22BB9|nr:leucyl aminopeptidase [Exilibacterium tricleocarpae]
MLDIHLTQTPPPAAHSDCVVVAVGSGGLSESAQRADSLAQNIISTLLERGTVSGEFGEVVAVPLANTSGPDHLLIIGTGAGSAKSPQEYRTLMAAACDRLVQLPIAAATAYLTELEVTGRSDGWKIQQQVIAAGEAIYQVGGGKRQVAKQRPLQRLTLAGGVDCRAALAQGLAMVEGIKTCKDLSNLPANLCTPTYLAEQAQELAQHHERLSTTVLDEAAMGELGMGALLSVGAGSAQDSRLAVMHYRGGDPEQPPHVILGKGITFDTGGIFLKNRAGMAMMKYDMGGAAAVIGTMTAAARLGLDLNIIGVIACAENMPGSRATKPSDVVTSMSGKTVEVLNTDAEGRLVLCDALTYIERFTPASVVDVATLTGACVVALGQHYSGLFANRQELADRLLAAGRESLDEAWQLPLSAQDMSQLDTDFADIANMGDGTAAAVVAALFLSRFAGAYPWAHLDISGTAKRAKPTVRATGRPVPLLMQYLLDLQADSGG